MSEYYKRDRHHENPLQAIVTRDVFLMVAI